MLEFTLASQKEIRAELALRLRKQRLAKGLTLSTLASRAGMGVATLQKLEAGKNCTLENFIRAVQALDLTSNLQDVFELKVTSIAQMERQAAQENRKRAPRKWARES